KAIMERTDAVPMRPEDEARYQVDQEDFFQSADNFRAWFLAGQLQGQLKARFGPAWWRSAGAGTFLKELWGTGNGLSTRELAQAIGERGIAPDVLLLRLGTTLQVPITLDAKTSEEAPAPPPAPAPEPAPAPPPPTSAPTHRLNESP
ncbi:MAG TPA: chromosome segregation protein SMC, partial [Hyalangium sp.]|nr:chromosome segregation protein SMC [Hyalangium sp.]